MTQREKKLVIVMGSALGLFGAYKAVMSTIVEPRRLLAKERETLTERKSKLEQRLLGEVGTERMWEMQVARTLAPTPKSQEAFKVLRADIVRLLKQHRLPEKGVQNGQAMQVPGNKTYRKDFKELPVTVDTEGTLDQLTAFLHEMYQLPYHVGVDRLNINPKDGEAAVLSATNNPDNAKSKRGGKSGRREGAENPPLKIHMTLSTLVLPRIEGARHVVYDAERPSKPPTRMQFDDPGQYQGITARNVFAVWQPKEVVVEKKDPTPETQVVTNPVEETKKPPPPDTRREKLVIIGTTSFDNEPVVFVKDNGKLTDPPKQYRLNDEVDGGKLVLIHKSGIVVRVGVPNGPTPPHLYFYPLGKKFTGRRDLTAGEFPEVYEVAQAVLQQ